MTTRGGPIAAVLGIALACATSSNGDPIPEDDLEAEVAEGICELRSQCDCAEVIAQDECRMQLEATLRMLFEPSREQGLHYDAGCAGEALALYDELQCDPIDSLAEGDACAGCKIYYGDRKRGEACERPAVAVFDECEQGSLCVGGTCVDPCERSEIGEPCLGRQCVDGATCQVMIDPETEAQSSECVPRSGLGESCMEFPCDDDLVCDLATNECIAAPGEGEPCSGQCAADAWCDTSADDSAAWVCRAPLADGTACTNNTECASETCEDGVCIPPPPFVCFFGMQ